MGPERRTHRSPQDDNVSALKDLGFVLGFEPTAEDVRPRCEHGAADAQQGPLREEAQNRHKAALPPTIRQGQ